jgi:hypothetical protein
VLSGLTALGAPAAVGHLAGQSVVAGMNVAAQFPAPLRDAAAAAVRTAFMAGLHRGSLFAACAAFAGSLVALVLLPARARASAEPLSGTNFAETPSVTAAPVRVGEV